MFVFWKIWRALSFLKIRVRFALLPYYRRFMHLSIYINYQAKNACQVGTLASPLSK